MKRVVYVLIVILALICLFLFLKKNPKDAVPARATPATKQTPPLTPNVPSVAPKLSREEQIRQAAEEKNTIIRFYGKVVDQDNKPVPYAKITIRILERTGYYKDNPHLLNIFTDSRGSFETQPTKGQSLIIESIEKEGYELLRETKTSFGYKGFSENFSPDPSNPVVFTLLKKSSAAVLLHYRRNRIGIPVDGTPTNFDLLQGSKVQEGDLQIALTRNPIDIVSGKPYNWKAKIELKGGGILPSTDERMFSAPENGYQPSFEIDMPADKSDWLSKYEKSFYIKVKDKYYGRMSVRLTTDYQPPPTGFTFEVWINPQGDRNLQFDYSKEISPEAIEQGGLDRAVQAIKNQ